MLIPNPEVQEGTLRRLKTHASRHYVKRGVAEIRGKFRGSHLFLEVVKEAPGGFVGRLFKMGSVRGVGRLARLEYLGPDKWKFLIFKPDKKLYGPYPDLKEGTIEQCLDAAARVYLT